MILTEEEAKGKVCPYTLRGTPDPHNVIVANCLASTCMAWRWQPAASMDRPTKTGPGNQSITRTRGYCGLAGAP